MKDALLEGEKIDGTKFRNLKEMKRVFEPKVPYGGGFYHES